MTSLVSLSAGETPYREACAPVSVRPLQPEDIPLLLHFIHGLAEYERLGHEVSATEAGLRSVFFGDTPRAFALIAEYEGIPAGYAVYFYNVSTFLGLYGIYLEDIFILPEFRGKGLGKYLLSHLAFKATSEGCAMMEWCVLDWNDPAMEFYHAMGAHPVREWVTYRLSGEGLQQLSSGLEP